jgi:uncharacterized protein with HEPN domain
MNGRRDAIDFVQDVIDWGDRALRHIQGMSREQFLNDTKSQDAVDKCICNIGEAANKAVLLDPSLRTDFPGFEADAAYAMRNILAHGYFAVDTEILWRTVVHSVPAIVSEARKIVSARGMRIA